MDLTVPMLVATLGILVVMVGLWLYINQRGMFAWRHALLGIGVLIVFGMVIPGILNIFVAFPDATGRIAWAEQSPWLYVAYLTFSVTFLIVIGTVLAFRWVEKRASNYLSASLPLSFGYGQASLQGLSGLLAMIGSLSFIKMIDEQPSLAQSLSEQVLEMYQRMNAWSVIGTAIGVMAGMIVYVAIACLLWNYLKAQRLWLGIGIATLLLAIFIFPANLMAVGVIVNDLLNAALQVFVAVVTVFLVRKSMPTN